MSKDLAAGRYALALFQLATEKGQLDAIEEELRVVKQVFTENKQLQLVLQHPKVSRDKKKMILKESFSTFSSYVVNTLMLLLDRHHAFIISEVAENFINFANEERGIAETTVYSVRPLSTDENDAISAVFSKKVGKQSLHIKNVVDKSLIGGIKIRIGNRIYDGSVNGKLERLERQLIK
jgi:F-type H+-transporting ATPase subunit delta